MITRSINRKSRVSILVPAWNAEKWIAYALKSAVAQTWPCKEIIVVNDGSTDGTLAVARRFESASVKIVSQENRGASAARNRALSLAQGEYIQWLDADNIIAPDKISRQLADPALSSDKRVLLSSAWGYFMYTLEKARFEPTPLWKGLTPAEYFYAKLNGNVFMIPESWLVSRELTEAAGPWDETLSLDDDGHYFARVVRQCRRIAFVAAAKSFYRYGNAGSLSTMVRRPDRKLQSQFCSMELQISFLLSLEDSPRTRAACVQYLQDFFFYFFPDNMELVGKCTALAHELGGELSLPQLGWKYAWIRRLFGWQAAKNVCFAAPGVKVALKSHYDALLYRLTKRSLMEGGG